MPQILTTRADKFAVLDTIEKIVERHISVGLTTTNRELVRQHMATIRADPRDLKVACRFETIPAIEATRIILDISHEGLPSIPKIVQDH